MRTLLQRLPQWEWVNFFLLFSIVLLSVTIWRMTSLHIGPSEVLFSVLFICLFRFKKNDLFPNQLVTLWVLLISVFCFGFFVNLMRLHNVNLMVSHDFIAYLFIWLVLCVIAHPKIDLDLCLKYGVLWFPLLAFFLLFSLKIGWYPIVYSHLAQRLLLSRFEALSTNPNQLALALLLVPFWQYYFYSSFKFWGRRLCLLSAAANLLMGYTTHTHALWLAWILSAVLVGCWYLGKRIRANSLSRYRWYWAGITALVLLLAVLSIHFFGEIQALIKTYVRGGELALRWRLWTDGIAFWKQSPWIGFGPGAFLNAAVPGALGAYEAHNVFIDVLLQGGIIGLGVYLSILYLVLRRIWPSPLLIAMFFSLIFFSCFHFILRQPIVWIGFYWLLIFERVMITRDVAR